MKKTIFKGAGVAIITPMNSNGSMNYDTLGKLIDFQIGNSTDAIISCGTTGESATLSAQEHREIIDFTIKRANKKIPVIAGAGSNNTETALHMAKEAEELGADGLLIVTPYYNKTSQTGLIKHYNYIADKVNTPIIVYSVPSRTGVTIQPVTYLELSKHPNIVATKDASADLSLIAKTISLCGDELAVYSGNDDQIVPVLSLGGIGVISVFSNICPDICHKIVSDYLLGNVTVSSKAQIEYLDLMNEMFCDVNPVPVKAALNMMGYSCGRCRMPLDELNSENKAKIESVLKKHSLI